MNERKKGKKMPAKAMIAALIIIVVAAAVHFAYFGQKNAGTENDYSKQTAKNPQNNQPQAQNQNTPQKNQPTAPNGTKNPVLDQNQGTAQALDQNSFDWHNEREIQDSGNNGGGTWGTQPIGGTAEQPKIINEECYQNCLEGKTQQECTAICEETP